MSAPHAPPEILPAFERERASLALSLVLDGGAAETRLVRALCATGRATRSGGPRRPSSLQRRALTLAGWERAANEEDATLEPTVAELAVVLERALARLGQHEREVLHLAHRKGLESPGIAQRCAWPVEVVEERLERAHQSLRRTLDRAFAGRAWAAAALPWLGAEGPLLERLERRLRHRLRGRTLATLVVVALALVAAWPLLGAARLPNRGEDAAATLRAGVSQTPSTRRTRILTGTVYGPDGEPLPGATVALGDHLVRTDVWGTFLVETARAPEAWRLHAVAPGLRPEVVPARLEDGMPVWPEGPLAIHLAETALEIAGHVFDTHGEPLPEAWVFLIDPESLAGTAAQPLLLERVAAGESHGAWMRTNTDPGGAFRLGGLARRTYALLAVDPETLAHTELVEAPSGASSCELRFEPGDLRPGPRGRAVDAEGRGVGGLKLAHSSRLSLGERRGPDLQSRRGTTTAPDGSFELGELGRDEVRLYWSAADVRSGSLLLGPGQEGELRIEVERDAAVRLDPQVLAGATHLETRAADGTILEIIALHDGARGRFRRAAVTAAERWLFSDRARTLVVYEDGVELERLPLSLVPGEENWIRAR